MHALWNTVFYQPIYNDLIFTINTITFGDIGFAVILITIVVKLVLFPLTAKSIRSQLVMKRIDPELKRIKKEFPNKEEQAKKTFELYKANNVNPFSGCLVVLLQLPIIFALYYVFYKGLPAGTGPLYPFVQTPDILNADFLGLVDLGAKSLVLALLAGVTQFIQGYFATAMKSNVEIVTEKDSNSPKTFQEQLSDSMQMNVRYVLPVFITFVAYHISGAVALYWVTSNIVTIIQEWYIRRKFTKNRI